MENVNKSNFIEIKIENQYCDVISDKLEKLS